jgi:hypothetical protein
VKDVHASAVKAVKMMRGESSRISRDCVSKPFSGLQVSSNGCASRAMDWRTKDNHAGAKSCRGCSTAESLESKEHGRHGQNAAYRGKQSHSHIRDARP